MPYDLYGTYYNSARDAENAEMAQCAAIDADIANRKVADLERRFYQQKQPTSSEESIYNLSQIIQSLEERIKILEDKITNQ